MKTIMALAITSVCLFCLWPAYARPAANGTDESINRIVEIYQDLTVQAAEDIGPSKIQEGLKRGIGGK